MSGDQIIHHVAPNKAGAVPGNGKLPQASASPASEKDKADLRKKNETLYDLIGKRMEGRMWSSNLRGRDEWNEKIDSLYVAFCRARSRGDKNLFTTDIDARLQQADQLAKLADIVQGDSTFDFLAIQAGKTTEQILQELQERAKHEKDFWYKPESLLLAQLETLSDPRGALFSLWWRDDQLGERRPKEELQRLATPGQMQFLEQISSSDFGPLVQEVKNAYDGYSYGYGSEGQGHAIDCSAFVTRYVARVAQVNGFNVGRSTGRLTTGTMVDLALNPNSGRGDHAVQELAYGFDYIGTATKSDMANLCTGDVVVYHGEGKDAHTAIVASSGPNATMVDSSGGRGVTQRLLKNFFDGSGRNTVYVFRPKATAAMQQAVPSMSPAGTVGSTAAKAPAAQAPAKGGKVVVLDMGHGGSGTPPRWNGIVDPVNSGAPGERHLNWMVGQRVKEILAARGITVISTKQNESDVVGNIARAEIANKSNADLFLRIHTDGAAASESGPTVYYPNTQGKYKGNIGPSRDVINASGPAAQQVEAGMREILGGHSNGVKGDDKTGIGGKQGALTGSIFSQVPTALVEMGNLDNKHDKNFLNSKAGQEKMAQAIAHGALKYLGMA